MKFLIFIVLSLLFSSCIPNGLNVGEDDISNTDEDQRANIDDEVVIDDDPSDDNGDIGDSTAGANDCRSYKDILGSTPITGTVINATPSDAYRLDSIIRDAPNGATILLADGTYNISNYIDVQNSELIIRSASGNREAVIIDSNYADLNPPYEASMILIYSQNVTIADITIKRSKYHLIQIQGSTNNILLHNIQFIDGGQQFVKATAFLSQQQYPDNVTVSCSRFEMTAAGRPNVSPVYGGCYTGGIDAHASRGWVVRDNHFEGIYCDNGGLAEHAIHFWRSGRDPLVERNTIVNCARGIGFGMATTAGDDERVYSDFPNDNYVGHVGHYGGVIRNNMISSNIGSLFDTGIAVWNAALVEVYNNTIYAPNAAFAGIDVRFPNSDTIVTNNISLPYIAFRDENANAQKVNNIESGIMSSWFVSPASGNLRLNSAAAAAINSGVPVSGLVDDIDHDVRDSTPNIGADEF